MAVAKIAMALVLIFCVSLDMEAAGAQVHHVVGGDQGWDPSTDVASWLSGRIFRVGDKIWFSYSAAQGSVAELKSKEEYESCDVSNPVRMYTDGINSISLDGEGIRYFASSRSENCKNGLKLHVEVMPQQSSDSPKIASSEKSALAVAAGPTIPSGSVHLTASLVLLLAAHWLCYVSAP